MDGVSVTFLLAFLGIGIIVIIPACYCIDIFLHERHFEGIVEV